MADLFNIAGIQWMDAASLAEMLIRFAFSTLSVWIIIRWLYYPVSHRRDYYFTFMLIAVSVFFLIYLLGGVKIRIGFALGLFAIFGIIRYRTESLPVREMTFLFAVIALSVINALASTLSVVETLAVNALFILAVWCFERLTLGGELQVKLVQYDRIDNVKPERRDDLLADLRERTGLDIVKVEVGGIDFLRDMAVVKLYYRGAEGNTVDGKVKLSREDYA